jgi:paraquat-inducible protein A
VSIFGMHNQTLLASGVRMLWDADWLLLAVCVGAFAVVLPFVRFGLLSAVLATVQLGHRPRWLGPGFRWALWLDVWAMPDVFLLACFIGYYRLINVHAMTVTIHSGGYCFIAAAFFSMLCRAALDKRTVWRAIRADVAHPPDVATVSCTTCDLVRPVSAEGTGCPRCGALLRRRKPYAMARGTALTVAALVLFFPANYLPMNVTIQMGKPVDRTIFEGVRELFQAGLWPIGVIIFCTSIAIPAVKILGMAWFLFSVHRRSSKRLVAKTKFHRFIAEIGRWSSVDPFAIAVFVPLMTFGRLVSSNAGWGSTAFLAVVVLTLLASITFDARLIWDAAEGSPV